MIRKMGGDPTSLKLPATLYELRRTRRRVLLAFRFLVRIALGYYIGVVELEVEAQC